MIRFASACVVIAVFMSGHVFGQDPIAVVDKAIASYGGADKLMKMQNVSSKAKGKMDVGTPIEFEQESIASLTGRIRNTMKLKMPGNEITQVVVYNGQKGWINVRGMTMDMDATMLKGVQEDLYIARLGQLTELKDPSKFKLSMLPEALVGEKPAVGIKVEDVSKANKDVKLYFDKASGLMVKMERQSTHPLTMKETTEERLVLEYQNVDGMPTAKKLAVKFDGKEFMTAEMVSVKFLGKVDDADFQKP